MRVKLKFDSAQRDCYMSRLVSSSIVFPTAKQSEEDLARRSREWEMYGAEREEVSESWLHTYDLSSTMIPNVSTALDDEEHFCKLILYKEIKDSRYNAMIGVNGYCCDREVSGCFSYRGCCEK